MDGAAPMAILLGVLALVMIGFFMAFWKRDKDRSAGVAEDSDRFRADPSQHNQGPGH